MELVASNKLVSLSFLLVVGLVLVGGKELCIWLYRFCKPYYYMLYARNINYYEILDMHDRIAEINILRSKLTGIKPCEVYLKKAVSNEELPSNELSGCVTCKRSLLDIKRRCQSMKFTECGHVFCLTCANLLHDNMTATLSRSKWPCPECAYSLKRDGLVRVSNLYL